MSLSNKAKEITKELRRLSSNENSLSINHLRVVIALERAIARLEANKKLARHLIFKGGFVLLKTLASSRFTRDIDIIGKGIDKDTAIDLLPKAIMKNLNDGLWYGDIKINLLEEQDVYGAVRFDVAFQIGEPGNKIHKLSRIHIDIGFGDVVPKGLKPIAMHSLFNIEKPVSWIVYPPEFIFSEKLQTLVERGSANSRAKDVFDLVMLSKECKNKKKMVTAINETFKNRSTSIPGSFESFIKSLDTTLIESSWKSINLTTNETISFHNVWKDLVSIGKKLDILLK